MVPCVLVTFEKEQIVIWRGQNYNRGAHCNSEEKSFSLVNESGLGEEKSNDGIPVLNTDCIPD